MNQSMQTKLAAASGGPGLLSGGMRVFDQAGMVGLTGFLFSVAQSICALLLTISGLRTLVGLGGLTALSAGAPLLAFHADAIRLPMLAVAVGGSMVNLYAIRRARGLRTRRFAAWRARPAPPSTLRAERLQTALAVVTLILVSLEMMLHLILHREVSLDGIFR